MAVKVARSNDCVAAAPPKTICSREGSAATPIVMLSEPSVPSMVSVPSCTDADGDGDGDESANADWIGSAPTAPMASVAVTVMPTGPMLSFERVVLGAPNPCGTRGGCGAHKKRGGAGDGV